MLSYQYTARNPATGQQVKATVEAESEAAAAKLISGQGLVPTDIRLGSTGSGLPVSSVAASSLKTGYCLAVS